MDRSFWLDKWAKNDIGFHQEEFNSHLTAEGRRWLAPGPVLVPLCGKSRDMLWLAEQGLDVIGVELAREACASFFVENGLRFVRERFKAFDQFRSETVTLWAGDFFAFQAEDVPEPIGSFYDRGALIALPPEMRPAYARKFQEFAFDPRRQAPLRGLLLSIEYDKSALSGPPFSVGHDEVERLYEAGFEIRPLRRIAETSSIRGVELEIVEHVYELESKSRQSDGAV